MSKGHRKRARQAARPQEQQPTIWRSPSPAVEVTSEEVQRLRWWFLLDLNFGCPHLWMLLHRDVWRSSDENAFDRWATRWRIVDQWFREAARDTLTWWTAFPESPQARLEPGCIWVFWRGAFINVKPFAPVFSDAFPRVSQPDSHIAQMLSAPLQKFDELQARLQYEYPAAFADRMRAQFEEQLKIYTQGYERGLFSAKAYLASHPQLRQHLLWVAHRFAGVSLEELLELWPGAAVYEDPEGTITRKTNELARKIGLTLRPWTRK